MKPGSPRTPTRRRPPRSILVAILAAWACAGLDSPDKPQPSDGAPNGQQCAGTTPGSFPPSPGSAPHPMGQLGACVPAAQCNAGSATLRSFIADRYCQDENRATCDANDDCLNQDCKGRLSGASTSVTLRNCQNTGPALCGTSGGIYCLCAAEINALAQLACGCECTGVTLP